MGRRTLLAVLLLAGFAAPARAAEVSVVEVCGYPYEPDCGTYREARLVASPGEANDVTVDFAYGRFVFRDRAPLGAGPDATSSVTGPSPAPRTSRAPSWATATTSPARRCRSSDPEGCCSTRAAATT